MVPDNNLAAAIRELCRLRIVPERHRRGLWPDRNIVSEPDSVTPSVKETVEIDHIAFPEKNFSAIEESATELHRRAAAKTAQPTTQKQMPQPPAGQMAHSMIVGISDNLPAAQTQIHSNILSITSCAFRVQLCSAS